MKFIRQLISVVNLSLRSLPQRLTTSLVVVIGIAGVVAVMVAVLGMATGMLQSTQVTGHEDRAIVMAKGASAEALGALSLESVGAITSANAVALDEQRKPVASAEVVRMTRASRKTDSVAVNVVVRGIGEQGHKLRPEVSIVAGRTFTPGLAEAIVGNTALRHYKNLGIGSQFSTGSQSWTIVGVFSTSGDSRESEIFADANMLRSVDGSNAFNSVTVRLTNPGAFTQFADELKANPVQDFDVRRESEYLASQSQGMSGLVSFFAYFIGGIMALGALFAALNTMYSAVSARSKEIAILRALGFGAGAIVNSVLLEALMLALIGGLLGGAVAWLFFNGHVASTAPDQEYGEIVFRFVIDQQAVRTGIIWACLIGLVGGLLPALRAARVSVAVALRNT